MTTYSYSDGQIIYQGNDPKDCAFLITSGQVKVTFNGYSHVASAGEIVGALRALNPLHNSETATAIDATSIQAIPIADIRAQLTQSPKDIQNIIDSFSHYVEATGHESTKVISTGDLAQGIPDLGPVMPLLNDDSVNDILINGHKNVYVERGGQLEKTDITFGSDEEVYALAKKMAETVGRNFDPKRPVVDARLLDGSRVNIIAPPLAIDGTTISIRKFARRLITIDIMKDYKNVSPSLGEFLKIAGNCHLNIVISGGTGSGKTTLLNAISQHISNKERIVTIEDSAELQLQQPHVIRLETRPYHYGMQQQEEVSMRDLVKNALRMRPDRIIVGEVRGPEAFDMMQAMNTGHEGSLTTIHANHPRDALSRIENMISMANLQIPLKSVRYQVASALHLIIQVSRMRDGKRRITHVSEIVGMEGDMITMHDLFNFMTTGENEKGEVVGEFKWSGIMPRFLRRIAYHGELAHLEEALGTKLPRN